MHKENLTISYSFLRRCAFLFISLPLLCFFIGWLKWYWSVLSLIALVVCIISADENNKLIRLIFNKKSTGKPEENDPDKKLVISKWLLIIIVVASCVYLIFCGVGRLWAQSDDYPWRNAIFRDIIMRDWPVYYDKFTGALCYYIGAWLPAAVPGKIVYLISNNSEAAFVVGNVCLLIYYTIGLTILFLLLSLYFEKSSTKHTVLFVLGFILFSGMDIVGNDFIIENGHIEWWALFYQYSSFTTCLCWVFNQALIPWLCMALLLHEKKVSNYVFIGMACLFAGPFPFIGYFIYCAANGLKRFVELIRIKSGKKFVREVMSISNIFSVFLIFPFVGTFILANGMIGGGSAVSGTADSGMIVSGEASEDAILAYSTWDFDFTILYFYFLLIEFGIYALLIFKENKKNFMFYVTVLQLVIYPLFNIGINSDFTMRASIPAIFIMYVLCYKFLFVNYVIPNKKREKTNANKKQVSFNKGIVLQVILVLCLLVGAVTPCVEFARGVDHVRKWGVNDIGTDYIVTLNRDSHPISKENYWPPTNFVTQNYDETVFFRYFARKKG